MKDLIITANVHLHTCTGAPKPHVIDGGDGDIGVLQLGLAACNIIGSTRQLIEIRDAIDRFVAGKLANAIIAKGLIDEAISETTPGGLI